MEALDQLKEIGIDELHEKTHISIHSLKIILESRYDDINTIQYRGFLSIIESNMHIDMNPLRRAYDEYKQLNETPADEHHTHHTTKESEREKTLFILAGIVIFVIAIIYFLSSEPETTEVNAANEAIEIAKNTIQEEANETEQELPGATKTSSSVTTFNPKDIESNATKTVANQPFVLYPKEKLWIGIINLDTGEKSDTITDKAYPLDENANLLISLGHGFVDVELYGETEKLTDSGRVRFLYKDGKLTHISSSKFKELNKGKSW